MPGTWWRRAPLLVWVLVLLLSSSAALVISAFVQEQQQGRFSREVDVHTQALRSRLAEYERLLYSARAAWLAHPDLLDEAAFAGYVGGIDLTRRYPGVQALGYAAWLPDGNVDALTRRLRRTVSPDFTVRSGPQPQRARAPISVIAPDTAINRTALGFDLYSEGQRRAALDAAARDNAVRATGRVALVQRGAQGEPYRGFLLTLPVYGSGDVLSGFLYVAVRADLLLGGLDTPALDDRLYTDVRLAGQALSGAPLPVGAPFREGVTLNLYGQPWRLAYGATSGFGRDFAAIVPLLTLLAGLLTAGLASLVVHSQVRARERAETLNQSLQQARTRQEQASAEFEAIFRSMQDAAAFTDPSGRVRLVNQALTEQFRLPASGVIGESLSALHLDRRLEGRATFQALTTPYRRGDGSVFSGEAQRSEVLDPQGTPLGLLEVVRDVSERVEAERALQAGERRYKGVLDAIPHLLRVSDPSGAVTYVNSQHGLLLGTDDLPARLSAEDRVTFGRLWEGAQARHEGVETELPLTMKDGSRRYFALRLTPIRGAQGEITEWVTSGTDIHDRLSAERLAQRNEERYRSVLEGLPQIVWLTDPQGQPLYFNRRWAEYVGAERAQQGFLNLLHPDDRAPYQRRWAAALTTRRPFEAEHRILGEGGVYRTFVTRGLPVVDARGSVLEWVGTCTDVDDSVYAETAARLLADVSEQLSVRRPAGGDLREPYKTALGSLTSRFADSAALWTAEPPELLAESALHPNWREPHMRAFARQAALRVAETAEPIVVTAHPLLHSVNATGALLYPLAGQGGTLRGVLSLTYRQALTERDQELAQEVAKRFASALDSDILQQRVLQAQGELRALNQSLEERVERRTRELESANRELEAFSYSVSHDLRTPLRHIVGFGDLLNKEVGAGLSPKGQRYLGIITDSATRMSQLIDDLLEFSRMGRQELRSAPVDLHALVQASWKALEPDRQGREVTLTLGELPTVQGDPAMLSLVFTNLLSNAIKYTRTRPHAHVQVGAQRRGDDVTISVRDDGVGFDPKYTDKLFGVFQRLHRAEEFEGIGIGLANVRRIVTRHGGHVEAEGQPGQGATFRVTLPVQGRA